MTNAEDIVTKVGKEKYFPKLYLCNGYWQIPIREPNIDREDSIHN